MAHTWAETQPAGVAIRLALPNLAKLESAPAIGWGGIGMGEVEL